MTRVDVFTALHKGLRAELFRVIEGVGQTDFADPAGAARAAEALGSLFDLVEEHRRHEDEVILATVAYDSPELASDVRSEHARLGGEQSEIRRLTLRLASADTAVRLALGRRIHERLVLAAAELLRHTVREEVEVNRLLWAHRGDAELRALVRGFWRSLPAERLARWLERVLPAANEEERASLLRGLCRDQRPELFEAAVAGARAALGIETWNRALALSAAPEKEEQA